MQQQIESGKVLQEQLRYIATHDELSGMPNRRHFIAQAELEMSRSRRHSRDLCVLLADLDHFKTVNDKYGHAAGDAVIKASQKYVLTSFAAMIWQHGSVVRSLPFSCRKQICLAAWFWQNA